MYVLQVGLFLGLSFIDLASKKFALKSLAQGYHVLIPGPGDNEPTSTPNLTVFCVFFSILSFCSFSISTSQETYAVNIYIPTLKIMET